MTADWTRMLLAPRLRWVQVAKNARTRGLAAVQHRDGLELAACDLTTGEVRRLGVPTDGFIDSAWPAADGEAIFYLADTGGNELGHLHRLRLPAPGQPLAAAEDLTPALADYTLRGADVSADGSTVVIDAVGEDGYDLYCLPTRDAPPAQPHRVTRAVHEAWNCRISADGTVATLDTTDHAPGTRQFAVSAYDVATGQLLDRLAPPPGGAFTAACCAPRPGDQRVAVAAAYPDDRSTVLIWDPLTGVSTSLVETGTGTLHPLDWSPDGRHILVCVEVLAEQWLERVDVESGRRERLDLPAGSFRAPYLRTSQFGADGAVLACHEHATSPLRLISWSAGRSDVLLDAGSSDGAAATVDRADDERAEGDPGSAFEHVVFASSDGTPVQAWLARPTGTGPHPAVVRCHGGPHVAVADEYSPDVIAWTRAGFAYLAVNYRGSSGRGRAFEEQIHGDVGHWELEDLAAAHRWLVRQQIAHPEQIVLAGESYGGFLVLYALARQPELWAAGIGEVALADWELTHRDSSPALRRLDEMLFGGPPETHAHLYRDRSPITHADQVRAPILLWQGSNDTRTPPAQVRAYTDRLDARGHPYQVHWFDGGHGFGDTQSHVEHLVRAVDFARAAVAGRPTP